MKIHTKKYFEFFGIDYDPATGWHDFIKCGLCDSAAVDICHIDPKGIGGRKSKENIYNYIALCRTHHDQTEGIQKDELLIIQKGLILKKESYATNKRL